MKKRLNQLLKNNLFRIIMIIYFLTYVAVRKSHILVYSQVNTHGVKCSFTQNDRDGIVDTLISPPTYVIFFPLHRIETLMRDGIVSALSISFRHSLS